MDCLDGFLLASLWDSGLSVGWYPLPQICPMVLDFIREIQPLRPGSANPCHITVHLDAGICRGCECKPCGNERDAIWLSAPSQKVREFGREMQTLGAGMDSSSTRKI